MKITVEKHFGPYGPWAVVIKQGCQTFFMDKETKTEASWYARMFRIALENNNEEVMEKFKRKKR